MVPFEKNVASVGRSTGSGTGDSSESDLDGEFGDGEDGLILVDGTGGLIISVVESSLPSESLPRATLLTMSDKHWCYQRRRLFEFICYF